MRCAFAYLPGAASPGAAMAARHRLLEPHARDLSAIHHHFSPAPKKTRGNCRV
jgi:hypothetical protein